MKLGRLLDGEIRRLGSLQDFIDVVGSTPVKISIGNVVGHQSTIFQRQRECSVGVDSWQLVLRCKLGYECTRAAKDAFGRGENSLSSRLIPASKAAGRSSGVLMSTTCSVKFRAWAASFNA
jgi:hypothetical protein